MAAMTDPSMPGDQLPADIAPSDLMNAYSAGYSHADVTDAMGAEPPRPDIGEIWGGTHPADATWTDAASAGPEQYSRWDAPIAQGEQVGQDKIIERSDLLVAAAAPISGLVKGAAEGVAEGVLSDIVGAQTNPIRKLVTTTTDDLASAAGNAIPPVVKYGAAATAGAVAFRADGFFNDPDQWKKDFNSQASLVNKGMTDEQNRKNRKR